MSTVKDYARFFMQAAARPFKIGAVAPSSRGLAMRMLEKLDPASTSLLVEVGPGTGAITHFALQRLKDHSQYIGFDINEKFISLLHRRFPDVRFVHDTAENMGEHLPEGKLADYIVCSLPWAVWPPKVQSELLHSMHSRLKPGGYFCTYNYVTAWGSPAAHRFHGLLAESFSQVTRAPAVWLNIPPAVVWQCIK